MDNGSAINSTIARLAELFQRNGYVRYQISQRIAAERKRAKTGPPKPQGYKKGDEIRMVANTKGELAEIRRLLRKAGFKPGRPFAHARQYRQPIYGRSEVKRFLELVSVHADKLGDGQ